MQKISDLYTFKICSSNDQRKARTALSMSGSQAMPVRAGEEEEPRLTSGLERVREMGRGRPPPLRPSVEQCRALLLEEDAGSSLERHLC